MLGRCKHFALKICLALLICSGGDAGRQVQRPGVLFICLTRAPQHQVAHRLVGLNAPLMPAEMLDRESRRFLPLPRHKLRADFRQMLMFRLRCAMARHTTPQILMIERQTLARHAAENHRADLYLLTGIDAPWVADPQRDRPHMREHMHDLFRRELESRKLLYANINGTWAERREQAITAINELLAQSSFTFP